jgi:hypothetical protein
VVPVLLETDVEVINVDGACCCSFIVSIGFWDGVFVISDVDLDDGIEETNCPLFVNSVSVLPKILRNWNIKHY